MTTLDWWVIGLYLAGTLGLSAWLARRQETAADYYVGRIGNSNAPPKPDDQTGTEASCDGTSAAMRSSQRCPF